MGDQQSRGHMCLLSDIECSTSSREWISRLPQNSTWSNRPMKTLPSAQPKEKEMGRGCAQQGLGALLGLRGAAVQQRLAVLLRVVEVPALHVVLRCHTHHPASSEAVGQSSCARRGGAPRKRRASLPASHSATSGDCAPHTTPTQRPPLRREGEWWAAPAPPAFPAAVGTSPRPCPAHGPPCRAWPAKPTASCRPRRPAPRARSTFPHQHRTHSHLPPRKKRGGEGGGGTFSLRRCV